MHCFHINLFALSCFIALSNATCATWTNIWEVDRSDTVDEAARLLGLPDYQVIEQMNPGINVEFVSPAQQITVPYLSPVSSPATWTTTGCSHILHLRYTPNTNSQSTDKHTKTHKPGEETLSNTAPTTTISVEQSTSLTNYKSSSISAMPQESNLALTVVVGYNSARTIRSSNTKAEPNSFQTQHSLSTEQSHSSSTQLNNIQMPTTSVSQHGISTEQSDSSSMQLSSIPMPTTSISTSSLSTKAPLPQCNIAGNFYTRNETQLTYAQRFCQRIGNFNDTGAPVSWVTLVQDDKEHFYMFSLEWLPKCKRRGFIGQDWNSYCSDVMRSNYILCINGGQGGYTDSDCLRYSYRPLSPTIYS